MNPVNTVGVMGAGLALQFKQRFPKAFWDYQVFCKQGFFLSQKLHVFQLENENFIVNFPTKKHWKDPSRLEYVEESLEAMKTWIVREDIRSVAMPKVGCGLGGLYWEDVQPKIEAALRDLECEVTIYI